MSEQKFKIGDTVQHKSSSLKMVIAAYDPQESVFVTCEWLDKNGNPQEKSFHQDTLQRYRPPSLKISSI